MPAEGAEPKIHHFLASRLELHRMGDGEPRRLLLEDELRLLVQLGALSLIGRHFRLHDEIVEALVAPFGRIAAARPRRRTAEQRMEEIVRIAVVPGPTELRGLVLARLN